MDFQVPDTPPTYREDENGDLRQFPRERVEHTPVTDLYLDGEYVGRRCQHCGMLMTRNSTPSKDQLVRLPPHAKPGVVRVVDNKAHRRRATAATETFWERFQRMRKGITE